MPIEKAKRTGFVDRLTELGAGVKEVVEANPDSLYGIRELCKMEEVRQGKWVDGYVLALVIGMLFMGEEIIIERRANALWVGAKI